MAQKSTKKSPYTIFKIVKSLYPPHVMITEFYLFGIKVWSYSVEGPYLESPSKGVDAEELIRQIYSGKVAVIDSSL
jgi:hypothetical protein